MPVRSLWIRQRIESSSEGFRSLSLPLLSCPTSHRGWVEPEAVIERRLRWQDAGGDVQAADQVLALLRLVPHGRESALLAAKKVRGEFGDALR
ncbi:MAG: hypothetical protein ACI841_000005 [Planctomycetota bacterium]|jgi:hypothetical protein